ncbi:putative bifunctional diguanylate cyclase/phosphodiesterase [Methylobacterium sp. J-068]|uniref:putative bifunctional diguanylate cyclase/phosphodiesterase n=1 Tax=Methylobacterium sp. J-068 TaxID=2836649 RepID=UPI001FB8B1BF|nr:GGDEF and EAL domain-containing protein [Methylobacterium sp. J-068]MCJ2035377.1 EAL domain-containing protein [Methylobacterium sp. J-068]
MSLQRLKSFGGEFTSAAREAKFQAERLPETLRHTRLTFQIGIALNLMFLLSDARFAHSSHFVEIVAARLSIVALSFVCVLALRRTETFHQLQRVVVVWQTITALAVGYLCTSRSDIALFVALMLPAVYMLLLPTSFVWTVRSGAFSAIVLLAAYLLPLPLPPTALGMVMAACIANTATLLFVIRSNRLRRLEWEATQAERRANLELAESRELFETMFRGVPVPIVVSQIADGRVISTNDAGNRFFRVPPGDSLANYRNQDFVAKSDRAEMQRLLEANGAIRDHEAIIVVLSGERRDVLLSIEPVQVEGAPCLISSLVDITDRKAAEEQIRVAAHHDVLTGLPNRALFHQTLDANLVLAGQDGTEFGLILLDLDAFKEINDTLGHDSGDALLKEVARRLLSAVDPNDLVARLGGDEFVIISRRNRVGRPAACAISALSERILEVLRQPMSIGGRVVLPRASLGLALYPAHADNAADLFTNADLALYAAKASGRNCATMFVPALRADIEARVTVTREMRAALEEGNGLVPYYQPKIHLASGAVIGFEALARWQHPKHGLLAPGAFAAVFDDPEIGIAVGASLRRQIFADVVAWIGQGLDPGRVFLNLSSAQFAQGDLAGTLLGDVDAAGVPRDRIGVEVTETVLLGGHCDRVSAVLDALHVAGIRVALDDFGTGYASLTHLKQFPVDEIKIDRSFIRDLERDANDAAIVTAVLQLGRSLGLDVTAEGVETPEQATFLADEGCTHVQGYLYSKPIPANRVPWFLRNRPDLLGGDMEIGPIRRIA